LRQAGYEAEAVGKQGLNGSADEDNLEVAHCNARCCPRPAGCGASGKQPPNPHEGKIKAPADGPVVLDHFDDGWPGYEKPVIIYH